MKYIYLGIFAFLSLNGFGQTIDDLFFGTDSTLDVMTWNIEQFPKNGQSTIDDVTEIIQALQPDVIAMQEVDVPSEFEDFIDQLVGYEGMYQQNDYARLAYIYKSDLEINEIFQIFTGFQYNNILPRPPIVMDLDFMGENFILINNHLKCCGDGQLNTGNTNDEENRRRLAVNTLHSYMTATYPNSNIILMGDLNDILTENNPNNNVFAAWTDDPENFGFADMAIATGPVANWSYPGWPSHLDHILVSNELFDELEADATAIMTIKIDDFFPGGWNGYEYNVSDHLPVALSFKPSVSTAVADARPGDDVFSVAPNPARDHFTLQFSPLSGKGQVTIYSIHGKKLDTFAPGSGEQSLVVDAADYTPGIYFATLIDGQSEAHVVKIQVLR